MMMKDLSVLIATMIFFPVFSEALPAHLPDTLQVVSHDKVKVITDPSKGFSEFPGWALFPPVTEAVRKITLHVTYQCPDSLHCGEWDYIDNIYVRRSGGMLSPPANLEIARLISPYGWRFDENWSFTWQVDVTDFRILLSDSAEIVFNHTGYESNTDRGWIITLRFEVITGKPSMQLLGMDTLWQGAFPYGDSTDPIENYLDIRAFTPVKGTGLVRLRILQTGHGMDNLENCAEFCSKYREVYFDGKRVQQRQIWQECGTNPLYPQAGTWIFDRAGWCPGSMVVPDRIDVPIYEISEHTVNLVMQPYVNPDNPTAKYAISACLFYYSGPWAKNDVSLERILVPGLEDESGRMNPSCMEPVIGITNNGKEELRSLLIKYGSSPETMQTYLWSGSLASLQSGQLILPGFIPGSEKPGSFSVRLESPNGKKDEYETDNAGVSTYTHTQVYGTHFVLVVRTNSDSTHNAYRITGLEEEIVFEREAGSLKPQTIYRDTLELEPGCYELLVADTAGDGLDFWFNPEGGYGYVRLLDMDGRLIKSFQSDFGSEIRHSFHVAAEAVPDTPPDELPIVIVFPPRNQGQFDIDLFCNEPQDIEISILTADSSRTVFEGRFPGMKEGRIPVDIRQEEEGIYLVETKTREKTIYRRIRIRKEEPR